MRKNRVKREILSRCMRSYEKNIRTTSKIPCVACAGEEVDQSDQLGLIVPVKPTYGDLEPVLW